MTPAVSLSTVTTPSEEDQEVAGDGVGEDEDEGDEEEEEEGNVDDMEAVDGVNKTGGGDDSILVCLGA